MSIRSALPRSVVFVALSLLTGCRFTAAPQDAVFACEDGKCPDGMTCSGGYCVDADPGCQPSTCAKAGANCGTLADGCGGTLDCGDCTEPMTCGGGGTPNVCAEAPCTPESDEAMCARFDRECGTLVDSDNCGGDRSVECGECPAGLVCGGAGVPFQCDLCETLTPEELCARDGITCASAHTTENCGTVETVSCGCPGGVCLDAGQCCIPEPDATYCAGRCGKFVVVDNCGTSRELSCDCDGGT